jgi:opacity protein-like surface antigen
MKKILAVAALAAMFAVSAKPAEAVQPYAYTHGAPWLLKAAAITVGVMTTSVMLNAIITNSQQKRPLTVEEAQYAAFLPFLWIVRPVAPPPAPARRR